MGNTKRGVILMNLGSPDSTGVKDLKRYLKQFLMDKRVIDYPFFFRKILVEGIIVPTRAAKSAEAYKTIWTEEGSPLIAWTRKLQASLAARSGENVTIAMRYGNPDMKSAYELLMKREPGLQEVIAVPLYPHYAMSSYETAIEHAKKVHKENGYAFRLGFIKPFYEDKAYIHAMAARIKPFIESHFDHLLFSFHGIPERHLTKTDPTGHHCLQTKNCCAQDSAAHAFCYRHQCFRTMDLLASALKIPKEKYSFSFQSRLGREQWLRPYTDYRLVEMPAEGIRNLLVICPAFVSDCLETLEEIEIRGKESFMAAGGEVYQMIPCLNDSVLWVEAIAGWVRDYFDGRRDMVLT